MILFANLAAIAIQNARTYEAMQRQAISDGLTGIHNYRHFQESLKAEVSRAVRYDESFCLLMMDLDHFKTVNDTVGHQKGDDVLRAVANVLRNCSRDSDYLARYGGEEFVMILPRTALDEATTMAERIRTSVARLDAGHPELRVTMSIGISAFPDSAKDSDGVLGAADAALLRAKNGGRNRVCLFSDAAATAAAEFEGDLAALGRRFAAFIGLSEAETAGLVTALAVHETGAAVQDGCRPSSGRVRPASPRSAKCARTPWTRWSTATSAGTAAGTRRAAAGRTSLVWPAPSPSAGAGTRPRTTATASPTFAAAPRASWTRRWSSASPPCFARGSRPQLGRRVGRPGAIYRQ